MPVEIVQAGEFALIRNLISRLFCSFFFLFLFASKFGAQIHTSLN